MENENETLSKIFDFATSTIYKWKKESRPIIKLLEQYFTKEDLEDFIATGKISKMERIDELLEIEKKYLKLAELFKKLGS